MNVKKFRLFGLALLLLFCFTFLETGYAATQTKEQAVSIAAEWAATQRLVLAGGTYQEHEYRTFNHKGMTYRYMASHLDSKKKLRAELEKSVTKKVAKQFIKDHGFIKHKRRLAQLDADGGSLLQWEKATARELKSKKNKKVFELSVPVGETGTVDKFKVSYSYVKKAGWRISKIPVYVK